MNTFKSHCIKLRKADHTLLEIMKITGRSKTSVYYHIKNIPLSRKKREEIKLRTIDRALKIAEERKGKSKRRFKRFEKWTPEFVLLVSHLIFDGEIMKKRCVYNNRSETLRKRVVGLISKIYSYPPIEHRSDSGVVRIQYNNVELANYLHKKAVELLEKIESRTKNEQREFLRAFFDDEGCMDYRVKQRVRRIRGYQNDKNILHIIQKLLMKFEINSRLDGRNEIVITGKDNLQSFQREINFSPGVRVNGARRNSRWKKSFEKRIILEMAIKSFAK